MKIKSISFDDQGKPVSVIAEFTIKEAAWIARRAGQDTQDDNGSGGLYHGLVPGVFNAYWSNGVDGYLNGDEE